MKLRGYRTFISYFVSLFAYVIMTYSYISAVKENTNENVILFLAFGIGIVQGLYSAQNATKSVAQKIADIKSVNK